MRVGAIVLAAGFSARMGANKLLLPIKGKPMIRHVVDATLASRAEPVIVVAGHDGALLSEVLADADAVLADNKDFAMGLSTSLKCGLSAMPDGCDGAAILLGDMPFVTTAQIDKLIAAFDPKAGRSICLPVKNGQRGHPVVWARCYFPEMLALTGDRGAKDLLARHADQVCEIAIAEDGPFLDIDDPETLARLS